MDIFNSVSNPNIMINTCLSVGVISMVVCFSNVKCLSLDERGVKALFGAMIHSFYLLLCDSILLFNQNQVICF